MRRPINITSFLSSRGVYVNNISMVHNRLRCINCLGDFLSLTLFITIITTNNDMIQLTPLQSSIDMTVYFISLAFTSFFNRYIALHCSFSYIASLDGDSFNSSTNLYIHLLLSILRWLDPFTVISPSQALVFVGFLCYPCNDVIN